MNNAELKYRAYFSYCNNDLDEYVVTKLCDAMTEYRIPHNLQEEKNIQTPKRDELVTDREFQALGISQFLIVVCSPNSKNDPICIREIEEFIKLRGSEYVLAVLIDGDTASSFPNIIRPFEPLATDLRGPDKVEEIKKELPRLLSTLLGIEYDDLVQRRKVRRAKQIRNLAIVIAGIALFFAVFSTVVMVTLNKQKSALARNQVIALTDKARAALDEGDKMMALEYAYGALTSYEGVDLPVTPEGIECLYQVLRPYNIGMPRMATFSFEPEGDIVRIMTDSDNSMGTVCVYDSSDTYTLLDVKTGEILLTIDGSTITNHAADFYGNAQIFNYFQGNDLKMYDITTGEEYVIAYPDDITPVNITHGNTELTEIVIIMESEGDYLYSDGDNTIGLNYKPMGDLFFSKDDSYMGYASEKGEQKIVELVPVTDANKSCVTLSISDDKELTDIAFDGTKAYVLLNCIAQNEEGSQGMTVVCVNLETGETDWSKTYNDPCAKKLDLIQKDEHKILCAFSKYTCVCLLMENGDVKSRFGLNGAYIGIITHGNPASQIICMNSKGDAQVLESDDKGIVNKSCFQKESFWELSEREISEVISDIGGYNLIAYNQKLNRIIGYSAEMGFMEPIEDENRTQNRRAYEITHGVITVKTYIYREIQLRRYGLRKESKSVNDFRHIKGTCMDIICMSGKRNMIGNSLTGKIVCEWDAPLGVDVNNVVFNYWGKDKYGNHYLGFGINTAIINKDLEHIGDIENMSGLNKEGDMIYIDSNGSLVAPVYSLDELLNMAAECMQCQ